MKRSTRSKTAERVVGSYEAKTKLSELLDEVAGGATITVTKRGRPVAKIVPVHQEDGDAAASKWETWFALRDGRNITTGGVPLRKLIEAGRRF